jgi:EthD domain
MKFFTLISAAAGHDQRQFQQWFLNEHAPMVLEGARGVDRYIVNLVDVEPPPVENIGFVAPDAPAPYHVVTEMWVGSPEKFKDQNKLYGSAANAAAVEQHLAARAGQSVSYRVTEIVEKDKAALKAGQRTPGLKAISLVLWQPGLSIDDGRNGWQVHATLALRTHVGMSKYVRNLVEETLSAGAPAYTGIGELHFASTEDMRYRLMPTPHSLEIIAFDTARWLGPTGNHYCSEWVLKL